MSDIKKKLKKFKKSHLYVTGILLLMLIAVLLLWFNNSTSMQAVPAMVADVYFEGEYRIGDGEWHDIVEGEHIPATKGDVILRGNFHMLTPTGEYVGIYRGDMPLAFYTDHIALTIYEGTNEPYAIDIENPLYGSSGCGEDWTAYYLTSESEEIIEILIHNPHSFGNETAIDELLAGIDIWTGIEFEKAALSSGETQRNVGMLMMLVSVVFLGIALFSSLIHVKSSKLIWLLGLVVLFAGAYFTYSSDGVSFWSESVVSNTTILGFSMMFYMLFLSITIAFLLKSTKRVGAFIVVVLCLTNAVCFVLPIVSNVRFYDTWIWWIAIQLIASVVLGACLIREFRVSVTKIKWLYLGSFLPMTAFAADVIGTWTGIWKGGAVSEFVFSGLFVVAILMILKLIPNNINAATKAKELEMEKIVLNAELTQSRM